MMAEWLDVIVRRVAADVAASRQFKGTLACTSFDPKTHTVKGIIVPHMLETGFVPLQAIQTSGGTGSGMFYGPTPGNASSLQNGGKFNGDLLDVEFDLGDPNSIVAKHRMSLPDNPPEVQSGEIMIQHEKGTSTYHKQDGSVVFTHFAKQGTHTWDTDGNVVTDTKGGSHTVKTGGGAMIVNTEGGTLNIN